MWFSCNARTLPLRRFPMPHHNSSNAYQLLHISNILEVYQTTFNFIAKGSKTFGSQFSIQIPSLSVDAACSGNPGVMEYRGVDTATGREIFRMGPYPDGTNNVGEFLALVHGLSLMKKNGCTLPIYSDSVSAIAWVRAKQCKTKLMRTERNIPLFDLIARAERWLQSNTYSNQILKWDTPNWGEIPADFGRK